MNIAGKGAFPQPTVCLSGGNLMDPTVQPARRAETEAALALTQLSHKETELET